MIPKASLFDQVVDLLSPYIGNITSKASVTMFLNEAGVTPEALGPQHLLALAGKIRPGLSVFVGKAKAEALANQIHSLGPAVPRSKP